MCGCVRSGCICCCFLAFVSCQVIASGISYCLSGFFATFVSKTVCVRNCKGVIPSAFLYATDVAVRLRVHLTLCVATVR